jgi:hypothetical protein
MVLVFPLFKIMFLCFMGGGITRLVACIEVRKVTFF